MPDFQPDLIFDVGMNNGEDTAFYLAKGFRVVAVEANPDMCRLAAERFRRELEKGRLTIVPKAVAAQSGTITLWVNRQNDEWSSLSQVYVSRNERVGAPSTELQVPAVRFDELLREHGIPYYLKIDIEGMDHLCLEALQNFSRRPRFVSVETSGTNDFDYTRDLFARLDALGYSAFKLVDQRTHHRTRLPEPALEGHYIDYRFPLNASSGPFGEETPGAWKPMQPLLRKYRRLLRLQARYTIQSENFSQARWERHRRWRRFFGAEPVGWYDIHAKLGPGADHAG